MAPKSPTAQSKGAYSVGSFATIDKLKVQRLAMLSCSGCMRHLEVSEIAMRKGSNRSSLWLQIFLIDLSNFLYICLRMLLSGGNPGGVNMRLQHCQRLFKAHRNNMVNVQIFGVLQVEGHDEDEQLRSLTRRYQSAHIYET
ncbi:hypothetical protein BC835DRAFT_1304161 [Cytidiella melzeri]|nr:hypothetical protein BC835DRAFT_1304161 [Cytidiella melzeri]